jgi:predicted transcriptional regulator
MGLIACHFVIQYVTFKKYIENDMTAISLRLPNDLEADLKAEAQLEGKTQSEIARLAITEYLARRERERFMAEMVEEMRIAYSNPDIRREALEIAEDLADDGLDAIITAELAAGIDPDEKWWR